MDVTEPERGTSSVAPALMTVGGAIGAVGSALTWASVSISRTAVPRQGLQGGQGGVPGAGGRSPGQGLSRSTLPQGRLGGAGRTFTIHGLDTTAGRLVLALCIAVVLVAMFAWLASRLWFRLGAVAIGLVLGVIVLVLAVVDLASPDSLFGAVATRLSTLGIPVSIGIGLWLVLAGAVVAVAAAVFWLAATRKLWAGKAEQPTTQLPPLTEPGLSSE
jgi:hypothetical protein